MKRTIKIALMGVLVSAFLLSLAFSAEDSFTLPAGSTLQVRLITTVSTKGTENGDPWSGRVMEPVFAGGQEVIPTGSFVEGHVTYVKPPGRVKGKGEMRLVAETISTPNGATHYSVVASLQDAQGAPNAKVTDEEGTVKGPGKSTEGTAKEAGVGAAAGAGVGAIAHGGSGALYGAGAGALAGVIHALAKRHKDVTLPAGTELTFIVSRDTTAKKVAPSQESSTK
jgi:type IV secretion system protein VirB10